MGMVMRGNEYYNITISGVDQGFLRHNVERSKTEWGIERL